MKNRYDFVLLFDAQDANPNGDPDAGNTPRVDVETGQGLVTDICLKRKVRNFWQNQCGQRIYFKERTVLNETKREAYKALNLGDTAAATRAERDKAREWMCQNFIDVRAFGAVMSHEVNCGQVRGPIQLSFGRSVDPIVSSEHAITLCAIVSEKDAKTKETDMGRKFTVPYGLYRTHGFVNPFLAEQTGFSDDDLELFFNAVENAFQFDQSAARPAGSMAVRTLLVFKHENQLGKAPSHTLFDLVQVKRKDESKPARAFADYEVVVDEKSIPEGVTLIRRI